LVGKTLDRKDVGTRAQADIGQEGGADCLTVNGHVHGDVTKIQSHNRRVVECSIGKQIWCADVRGRCNLEIDDVQASEFVQTLHLDLLVVVDRHRGETTEVELGLSVHVDCEGVTAQNGLDVVGESVHVLDLEAGLINGDVGDLFSLG